MNSERMLILVSTLRERCCELLQALTSAFAGLSSLFCREVNAPYRSLIDRGLEHMESHSGELKPDEREKWNEAVDRQNLQLDNRLKSIVETIEKEERDIEEEEERVEYRIDYRALNPSLVEKESQIRLKRDILSREIFELKAGASTGFLNGLICPRAFKSRRQALRQKEEEQRAVQRELFEIRLEWEAWRRSSLEKKCAEMNAWQERIINLSRMRMERDYMQHFQKRIAARLSLLEILAKERVIPSILENSDFQRLDTFLKKKEKFGAAKNAYDKTIASMKSQVARLGEFKESLEAAGVPGSVLPEWDEEEMGAIADTLDRISLSTCRDSFEDLQESILDFCRSQRHFASRLETLLPMTK